MLSEMQWKYEIMPRSTTVESEVYGRGAPRQPVPEAVADVSPTYYLADQLTGDRAIRLASRLRRLPLQRFRKIVLSFTNVTALDATGLAILVRLYSQLVANRQQLVLRDISPPILKQLAEVGLDSLFAERPVRGGFLRPITDRFRALSRA